MKAMSLILRLALTAMFIMVVVVMIEAQAVDKDPLETTTENPEEAKKACWGCWKHFCIWCR